MNWLVPIWAFDIGELLGALLVLIVLIISAIKQVIEANRSQKAAQQPLAAQPNEPPQDELGRFLQNVFENSAENQRELKGAENQIRVIKQGRAKKASSAPVVAKLAESAGKDRFGTEKFDNRFKSLDTAIEHSREKFTESVHDAFDHDISQLARESRGPDKGKEKVAAISTDAAGFAAMLASAENLRQAIVISEIMKRPDERWL